MKRELVINPCKCDTGRTYHNAYVKITYDEDRLSLTGVIGPRRYGEAYGSSGQCIDDIRDGKPTKEWTQEMLNKLCDIWEEWHLNDMRPYCEHQKELGWDEISKEKVKIYSYVLKYEVLKEQNRIKNEVINRVKKGLVNSLNKHDQEILNLSYTLKTYDELNENLIKFYKPDTMTPIELKYLGWLRPSEHPEGILTKPCPVCGYKYGTEWKTEKMPEKIINWLFCLPKTQTEPAWI